jgi:DNA polymerase
MFERYGWIYFMQPKLGFPGINLNRWTCTLAKCAAHGLPIALGQAAKALGLDVSKDNDGYRVMMRVCKPDKYGQFSFTEQEAEKLYAYNIQDVEVERRIDKILKDLNPTERQVWMLDREINERGLKVNVPLCQAALRVLDVHKASLAHEFQFATDYALTSPAQRKKLLDWLNAKGVEITDTKATTLRGILETLPAEDEVGEAIALAIELGKTSVSKFSKMISWAGADSRVRDQLQYHAAGTGRWGGRGFQPQNMVKGKVDSDQVVSIFQKHQSELMAEEYDALITEITHVFSWVKSPVFEAVSSMVRGMIEAKQEYTLVGGDYSAIEARVLAWLVDEKSLLDIFANDLDPYKDMATHIFNVSIDEVTSDQRFYGKSAVLGCGYQMGWKRFATQYNVEEDVAQMCVTAYRDKYSRVVSFWDEVNHAAKCAVRDGQTHYAGKVAFKLVYGGRFLACRLPSGRCIMYPSPRLEIKEAPWHTEENPAHVEVLTYAAEVNHHWLRESTYGGKLTENICQGIARDVMADAMLRLKAAGHQLILTIHDELIEETQVKGSAEKEEEFRRICETPPSWALDLPLKMETWRRTRYKK